jgi:hypothetical protein
MHGSTWTPTIVPYGADQTAYIVIDRFERPGGVYRETEVERTDLETVITDLMSGQFNDPVRVVAFNTLEHWSENVSKDIALEIQTRCDIDSQDVPESIRDFVDSHVGPDRQLALLAAIPKFDHRLPRPLPHSRRRSRICGASFPVQLA